MISFIASGPPLNGTCTACMPALDMKRIALRWVAVPTPADPKFMAPGFAFAAATKSATVLKPLSRETTSTLGTTPSMATAEKSVAGL